MNSDACASSYVDNKSSISSAVNITVMAAAVLGLIYELEQNPGVACIDFTLKVIALSHYACFTL